MKQDYYFCRKCQQLWHNPDIFVTFVPINYLMMKQINSSIYLTLLLLLGMLLASCSGSEKRHIVIGVSQCSEDVWRERFVDELRLSSYAYDDDIEIRVASTKDNDEEQIKQIEDFMHDGVDLLIVSPNQMHAITPTVDRAFDKGIPVILFDRKTDSEKYTAFIGADNVEVGRTMGEYVATKLHGQGNIVEITGLMSSSPAVDRQRGFQEAVSKHPGLHIVKTLSADWLKDKAQRQVSAWLDSAGSGSQVDCVFGHNDRMALGAREAFGKHGQLGNAIFVGVDALPGKNAGLEAVNGGQLAASYMYPTRGDQVLQLAMNILQGKPYQKENKLKSALVTQDNAYQLILQHEEMQQQQGQLKSLHNKVQGYLAQFNHQRLYVLLLIIIVVLIIGISIYVNRTMQLKRKLTEESTQAKLQFFTNVSHEFRTPLTLIIDPLEQMSGDRNLTATQHRMLRMASRNAKLMLQLVSEILDFRKIQNGKMHLHVKRFNLSQSLREWTEGFEQLALSRQIQLMVNVPDGLIVSMDRGKMERIVFNLLSNAIKYTPKGGHITVAVTTDEQMTHISVADSGKGIARDEISKVFDRFYQAKNNVGGSGIGLAIVKAFAEVQGGGVTLESELGKGSTFTVSVPVVPVAPVEENVAPASEPGSEVINDRVTDEETSELRRLTSISTEGNRPVMLIVDDNADIRSYVSDLFAAHFDIVEAENGQEGLDKALKNVPDVIVCDVMMPVMDGLEMCRRVKAETATSHIPVILLTARTQDDHRAEGYDCGADAYITKPFSGKVMVARVINLLEGRQKLRDLFSKGEEAPASDDKPMDADRQFLSAIHKEIQEHLGDSNYNVEVMAGGMGLSRVQLYRKVKALTGSTPVELLRITRIKKAQTLLKTTSMNVSEVAYQVGFSSPSYFTKCYKAYFGKLPKE